MRESKLFYNVARAKGISVCQAKVTRGDTGKVEYRYSTPVVPWWDIPRRLWVRMMVQRLKETEV